MCPVPAVLSSLLVCVCTSEHSISNLSDSVSVSTERLTSRFHRLQFSSTTSDQAPRAYAPLPSLVLLALPLGHHGRTYLSLRSPPRAVLKPHIDSSGAILACQLVRGARAANGTRSPLAQQTACARPTHTHTHTHTTMRTQGPSATCRSASSPTACPPQPTHPPRSPRPCPPPSAHGCARARVPSHVS